VGGARVVRIATAGAAEEQRRRTCFRIIIEDVHCGWIYTIQDRSIRAPVDISPSLAFYLHRRLRPDIYEALCPLFSGPGAGAAAVVRESAAGNCLTIARPRNWPLSSFVQRWTSPIWKLRKHPSLVAPKKTSSLAVTIGTLRQPKSLTAVGSGIIAAASQSSESVSLSASQFDIGH
jgi:hypothetical protein